MNKSIVVDYMCGIIGYIGQKPAAPVLLTGLKRMEYRGYDSAGIVTIGSSGFELARARGKVVDLEAKLNGAPTNGSIGIGHTRWATHGGPSERNAHPHVGGKIAIIHNGIVENHAVLRTALQKAGAVFQSDTDSEVLAWLINQHYDGVSLKHAVLRALEHVDGAFGLVAMAVDRPDELVTARRSSPIIIGRSADAVYVASDAAALAGYAQEILHLEDDEVAVCRADSIDIYTLSDQPQTRDMVTLDIPVARIQKQGYKHFLIKEIMEQPEAVRSVLRGRLDTAHGTSHLGGLNLSDRQIRKIDHIFITGCGTAYYAGLFAKYMLEKMTGLPVSVETASEFRYRDAVLPKHTVGLVVSQSGETADTRAANQELQRRGIHTLGIVNVVGSTIAREVNGGVYLHAGPEISVASTKAFTSQVLAMLLFGLHVARLRGMSHAEGQEIVSALEQLPRDIEHILTLNDTVKKQARRLAGFDNAFYLGRDNLYPIALEGSHKLKEVSYMHAEAYASGEMKHGANALIDENLLIVYLLGTGRLYEKSQSNLAEVEAREGTVFVVTDDKDYPETHPRSLYVPTTSAWTAPLLFNVVLQMVAYHVANVRNCEIDQPRNLAKSVTVE